MKNDSTAKTLLVALLLCLVCSIVVSSAAVGLRGKQEENKKLYEKKNLLLVAGLLKGPQASKEQILKAYESVETKVIDFSTGQYVSHIDPETYDQEKASKNSATNITINSQDDIAGIKTRARYGKVYLIHKEAQLSMIILPIKGKGLWSTLYGLLALHKDGNTIYNIGFYQHGETPGLGGEIDNPNWQALWKGKKVYNDQGIPALDIVKGTAGGSMIEHKIDGLTGATITSDGVENLVHYWHSDDQYGTFLKKIRGQVHEY